MEKNSKLNSALTSTQFLQFWEFQNALTTIALKLK